MTRRTFISKNELETFAFAKTFARTLRGGEAVALIGELGSGKTTFVRGLARAFGIREPIRSPTFTLLHVHRIGKWRIANGKLPAIRHTPYAIRQMVHVDAYRLRNARELEEIGIGEYLGRPDTVVVIEWADRVRGVLTKANKKITLRCSHGKRPDERRFLVG